jgi:hypothetical protein
MLLDGWPGKHIFQATMTYASLKVFIVLFIPGQPELESLSSSVRGSNEDEPSKNSDKSGKCCLI